jgi:hypothetical protein
VPTRPRSLHALLVVAVLAAVVVASGCTSREPIHLVPDFAEHGIDRIVVMPVIDRRFERFEHVRLTTYLRDVVHRALEKKGYTAIAGSIAGEDGASVAATLPTMSVSQLAELGPPEAKTLLYVYFDELKTDYDTGGDEARIKISAVLIDKATRSELWHDRGVGVSHLGGLLSLASPPSSEYEAVHNAVKDLFLTLPKRAA